MKKIFQFLALGSLITGSALAAGVAFIPALIMSVCLIAIANCFSKTKVLGTAVLLGITPQTRGNMSLVQTGTGTNVKTGEVSPLASPDMKVQQDQEFEIVITNTSAETAVTNAVVIPYSHDSTASTAVTNLTITSSAGSRANTMEFFKGKKFTITEWHLQVTSGSASTMMAQKFEVSEFQLNGSDTTRYIQLSKYRQSNGGEILDTADIYNEEFVNDGWHRLRIPNMPANTQLTIRVRIPLRELAQMKATA